MIPESPEGADATIVTDEHRSVESSDTGSVLGVARDVRSRPVAVGLAVAAIALAGAVFMLVVAVTEGMEGYLRAKISAVSPHIVLKPERTTPSTPRNLIGSNDEFVELAVNRPPIERKELKPWLSMIERIERSTPLVTAVSPFVSLEGVVRNGARSQTATVRGIDPARELRVGGVATAMLWGDFDELRKRPHGIVIGRGISRRLRVTIGDDLQLVTATGKLERFEVAGVFETGVDELDERRAYITLEHAQTLRDMSRIAVTGMNIRTASIARSPEARGRIESATGYRAETLEEAYVRPLAFHRRHAVAHQLLAFMLLLVATFGTANALQGAELARRSEQRQTSVGAPTRRERARRLMRHSLLIGSSAGVLAVAVGWTLIRFAGDRIASIGLFPRNNPLIGFHPERFHVEADPLLALATFGVGLLVAVTAGMLTASRLSEERREPAVATEIDRGGDAESAPLEALEESLEPVVEPSLWRRAIADLMLRRVQSLLVTGGIALATAAVVVTLALFGGLLDTFRARILDVTPHVTMTPAEAKRSHDEILVSATDGSYGAVELVRRAGRSERPRVRNGIAMLRIIERGMGDDVRALSPFLTTQALAGFGTTETTLELHGVYPERESVIADLKSSIKSGSVDRLQSNRSGVLLGERAAAALGASVGSRLRLVSVTGEKFNAQVVGIYATGVDVVDRRGVVNLRLAQALENALPGEISGVGIQTGDPSTAAAIASRVERMSGRESETWEETHAPTIANFRYLRDLFLVVTGLLVAVCALALTNVMMRVVADSGTGWPASRSGTTGGRALHMAEAVLLSGVGAVAGVAVGLLGIQLLSLLPGLSPESGVVSFQTARLPVVLHIWHPGVAIGLVMTVCMIAVMPPILRAGRTAAINSDAIS